MNRKMRRISEKEGRRVQKLGWNEFKDVTVEALRRHLALNGKISENYPDQVFQNNLFIVQVFKNVNRFGRIYTKIMIRRSDSQPIEKFTTLQRIKNEILGTDVEAIQFFPKESELVDVANLYWLWIENDFMKNLFQRIYKNE
jgi:hypothetical protein